MTKKEIILEQALELFGENGYNATSTKKIAKAAGVSEWLIFSHFTNKAGLLDVILEKSEKKIDKTIKNILLEKEPKDIIRKTIEILFEYSEKDYHFWKLTFQLKWELNYTNTKHYKNLYNKLVQCFDELWYEESELEAKFLLQTTETILSKIVKGEKTEQEKIKVFLLKKYNI